MKYSLTVHKTWFLKEDEEFTVNYDLTDYDKTIEEVISGWEDAGYEVQYNTETQVSKGHTMKKNLTKLTDTVKKHATVSNVKKTIGFTKERWDAFDDDTKAALSVGAAVFVGSEFIPIVNLFSLPASVITGIATYTIRKWQK